MPTQEERLTSLEQRLITLQEKTSASIVEIDENTTILLGVIRRQGQDIRVMNEHLTRIDQRLDHLEIQLNEHTTHLNRLETKFDEQTKLLTQILDRLPKNS